jgi:hypothetical protein
MHCGNDFRAITFRHLRNIHGYEGDHPIHEYKERFGLRVAMCAESTQKISEAKDVFWATRGQHSTERKLIAELRTLHRAGQRLGSHTVPIRLSLAARRLFGSWERALAAAGLDYEQATGNIRWDRKKVIAAVRDLAGRAVPLNAGHRRAPFWKNAA